MTLVVAVAPVTLEQAASPFRKRHNPLAPIERNAPHQTLISQVSIVVVARVERPLAGIAEVAFRDNPKRPDRRERAAVFAVELVAAVAFVQHNLALEAARQVEALHERVSWIPIAVRVTISAPLAPAIFGVPRVVVPPRS
jgi:hypothetical protein